MNAQRELALLRKRGNEQEVVPPGVCSGVSAETSRDDLQLNRCRQRNCACKAFRLESQVLQLKRGCFALQKVLDPTRGPLEQPARDFAGQTGVTDQRWLDIVPTAEFHDREPMPRPPSHWEMPDRYRRNIRGANPNGRK